MRTKIKDAEQAVVRAARVLMDSLGDGLGLENCEQLASFHELSLALVDLDEVQPSPLDTPAHVANADGPDTEHIAARMILPMQHSVRRKVLQELRVREYQIQSFPWREDQVPPAGMACHQLVQALDIEHKTTSSAVNWLANNGWITDSGQRINTPSRRPAIVWQLTKAAREAMKETR